MKGKEQLSKDVIDKMAKLMDEAVTAIGEPTMDAAQVIKALPQYRAIADLAKTTPLYLEGEKYVKETIQKLEEAEPTFDGRFQSIWEIYVEHIALYTGWELWANITMFTPVLVHVLEQYKPAEETKDKNQNDGC